MWLRLNSKKMAEGYLKEAEIRLETARNSIKKEFYAYVVRQCQECVELSLKSALRFVGIETPKMHDVGINLREEKDRFPEFFKREIPRLSTISRELRWEREPSMYGDEEFEKTAEELYTEFDAKKSLENTEFVFSLCKKLIKG